MPKEEEIKQIYLEPESEHPTWDEMRAFVNSSLTGMSQPMRVISQQIESAGFVEHSDENEGNGWKFDAQGNLYANSGTFRGTLTAPDGVIGGFTITATELYGGIIKTAKTIGAGTTGVIMDTDGLRGYDSVLGNTFNLPTDGSAPTFASGIINETIFEISTNAILRTSSTIGDGSASSAGVLINNTGLYICEANQAAADANIKALVNGSVVVVGDVTLTGGEVSVQYLTAGIIASKAISLGVTAGTGDCYISGGAGLDYANWTADKGFILGLDDSDDDKAKFFVGDHANNKYLNFDGTNTDATGFRYIEILTAGENISIGNVLCIKPKITDYTTSWGDSVVNVDSPDSNYEGTTLYIDKTAGVQKYQGYVQLSLASLPSTEHILKAILRLKIYGRSGVGLTCVIKRVTSAWDASTITWNTKPTETAFADGDVIVETIGSVDTWVEFDITQVLRKIKNADYTNNGFQLYLNTNGWIRLYDASEAEADRPHLRVYELNSSDGKVYKADHSYYENSRFIAGISTESKNKDEAVKVQTGGQNSDLSGSVGENVYIASTGGTTNSTINLTRIIRLGTFVNTNKILIEKEYSNLFIEKNAIAISLSAGTGKVIIAPDDAKTMRISIPITGKGWHDLIVSRTGVTSVEQRGHDGSVQQYAKASWSGKVITITAEEASTNMNYYFYR